MICMISLLDVVYTDFEWVCLENTAKVLVMRSFGSAFHVYSCCSCNMHIEQDSILWLLDAHEAFQQGPKSFWRWNVQKQFILGQATWRYRHATWWTRNAIPFKVIRWALPFPKGTQQIPELLCSGGSLFFAKSWPVPRYKPGESDSSTSSHRRRRPKALRGWEESEKIWKNDPRKAPCFC